MSHQTPSLPEDQPLDAIVYDVHPALLPRGAGQSPFAPDPDYPYAAGSFAAQQPGGPAPAHTGADPIRGAVDLAAEMLRPLNLDLSRKADYVVPQRFGMSAILGIMTALGVLFGGLRLMDAAPVVYLFFGLQAIIICIAQMFQGHSPRAASALAGAILLPLFLFVSAAYFSRDPGGNVLAGAICFAVVGVPFGAFLGYLTGTCAAGVFLLMDALERYIKGQRPVFLTTNSTTPRAAP